MNDEMLTEYRPRLQELALELAALKAEQEYLERAITERRAQVLEIAQNLAGAEQRLLLPLPEVGLALDRRVTRRGGEVDPVRLAKVLSPEVFMEVTVATTTVTVNRQALDRARRAGRITDAQLLEASSPGTVSYSVLVTEVPHD